MEAGAHTGGGRGNRRQGSGMLPEGQGGSSGQWAAEGLQSFAQAGEGAPFWTAGRGPAVGARLAGEGAGAAVRGGAWPAAPSCGVAQAGLSGAWPGIRGSGRTWRGRPQG
jgi:hypothetical protein